MPGEAAWPPRCVSMLIGIALCAAAVADSGTLRAAGRALVDRGGTTGGPGETAHPLPDRVSIVPLAMRIRAARALDGSPGPQPSV